MISSALEKETVFLARATEEKQRDRTPLVNLVLVSSSEKKPLFEEILEKTGEKLPAHFLWVRSDSPSFSEEKLSFLLLSHFSADLPIYVIWTEALTPSPLLNFLQSIATKMIFDGGTSTDLQEFSQTILQIQASSFSRCHIGDLQWRKIENWRHLLTSIFHPGEKLSALHETAEIVIDYQSDKNHLHSLCQALYLQGWLATQLEWKRQTKILTPSTLSLIYQTPLKKQVEVLLIGKEESLFTPGTILSFSLTTHTHLHLLCKRNPETAHQIKAIFSTPHHCDLPLIYPFSQDTSAHAIVKEIWHKQTSDHYLRFLARMAQGDFI